MLAFVYQWFAAFDHQREVGYYLDRIAEPVDMQFPDFPIQSKEDFIRWYKEVQDNIDWNSHDLQNVTIEGNEQEGWSVSYDVLWKARDSKGTHMEMTVHQELTINRIGNTLKITKHRRLCDEEIAFYFIRFMF